MPRPTDPDRTRCDLTVAVRAADGDSVSRRAVDHDATRLSPEKGTLQAFPSGIINECQRIAPIALFTWESTTRPTRQWSSTYPAGRAPPGRGGPGRAREKTK